MLQLLNFAVHRPINRGYSSFDFKSSGEDPSTIVMLSELAYFVVPLPEQTLRDINTLAPTLDPTALPAATNPFFCEQLFQFIVKIINSTIQDSQTKGTVQSSHQERLNTQGNRGTDWPTPTGRTYPSWSHQQGEGQSTTSINLVLSQERSGGTLPTCKEGGPTIGARRALSVLSVMDDAGGSPTKQIPVGLDAATQEEYASVSKLLQEFMDISTIDKAWTFKSVTDNVSRAMFVTSQPNLLSNKRRKSILSSHILQKSNNSVSFHWAPFPIEMTGVSTMVPSPSGSKLLVIRNSEGDSPTHFEVWDPSQVKKEFAIPRSTHGSVYSDGWFEGISWNADETVIAYVAEEPDAPKPTFTGFGYKKEGNTDKDCGSWKGQGDWEEDWGETYAGKRQPALFVIDISSGEVLAVPGVGRKLSVGQVVWAPSIEGQQYLVFVGWPSDTRKLGIKYCYNRPCALYAVKAPLFKSEASLTKSNEAEDSLIIKLTQSISSAFFPCFSPDGKFLVFLSAKSSVDSGAHSATESLHKVEWPSDGKLAASLKIIDVVPVVMCPEDGCFPGLYCSKFLTRPWLSDGHTLVLSSYWGSTQKILSVDVLSGQVSRISPDNSNSSWDLLALDGDNIIAGASKPIEAIYVSSKSRKSDSPDPLIVILHGGPHSVSLSSFSKSSALLASLGYSLLIVNYRGSLGFGEEALQSLPGKIGSQDVSDVLTAIDHVIDQGLADPSKIAVLGGSHGGFLTTHLIGQAPEKFAVAATRNPVCNLSLMVGTTDIPDWCYFEVYGSEGKSLFTETPSAEHLALFYSKSPICHISKVKTPTLFLLGAQDLRVPVSNGIQYARALKEKGVETKVIVFPHDVHGIDRPQSDFESFLNVAPIVRPLGYSLSSFLLLSPSDNLVELFLPKFAPILKEKMTAGKCASDFISNNEGLLWFRSISVPSIMDDVGDSPIKQIPEGLDAASEEEFASLSKLLQEFTDIPTIDKAWTFKSEIEDGSSAMFLISKPDLLSNKMRKSILSSHILEKSNNSVSFHWAPFPIEMTGVSAVVASPSGSKLLVIRNSEGDSPTHFEIWDQSQVKKEFAIPRSIHGSVYSDGWFEGISWNLDETVIAYVAEEPDPHRPTFSSFGYKKESMADKEFGSWKGQGDWQEDWGETYSGKRQPALFVIDIFCGEVRAVTGVGRELSIGQVVWAPSVEGQQYLVFVGWPSKRKFGVKYCSNRPCALYAVKAPSFISEASATRNYAAEDLLIVNLTQSISSALFPRFSQDGKFLVFLSAKSAVDSGAHLATDSLHKIEWPSDGNLGPSLKIIDVASDKFAAAAARNPVCNFALMVGTSDIPDWCFFEAYGSEGKSIFTESPSAENLALFHSKSPISHVSKVKTPTLFLLGARDLRVPIYDGIQYARALKENGVETKVIMFPNDVHAIKRPQSDFESFLNIGAWFKKYCR
ncbi:Acylamino-acid-releasing enzyme [Sesamum angolense]|uniref:acylaminoacyl-peptidase n=1 Tax=Sesamum angolense TaxID=2727404 RepID=A0AAE1X5U8_9LAMI|nr:Acylamino-acid-releasing enzyme [Sesamum angolense]